MTGHEVVCLIGWFAIGFFGVRGAMLLARGLVALFAPRGPGE